MSINKSHTISTLKIISVNVKEGVEAEGEKGAFKIQRQVMPQFRSEGMVLGAYTYYEPHSGVTDQLTLDKRLMCKGVVAQRGQARPLRDLKANNFKMDPKIYGRPVE